MFFVSRSVEQRNHAAPLFQPFDLPEQFLLGFQFFAVFLLEGSPFVGIVREPFAQSIGGRNVPQPQMDSSFVLDEPSGPQPVHQNADAVILFRWVVDSLTLTTVVPGPRQAMFPEWLVALGRPMSIH